MNTPRLYFRKTYINPPSKTFEDCFSHKNMPDYDKLSIKEIEAKARERIGHWNIKVSDWLYELIGWRVEE